MTREEAIYKAKHLRKVHPSICIDSEDFWETVITALEQEPCEDAISRQAVMDCFKKWQPYMATRLWDFEQELSALPSVKPQHRIWRWIEYVEPDDAEPLTLWRCDNCDTVERRKTLYCPMCGAKMEVEE